MAVLGLGLDLCSVERIRRLLQGPRARRFLDRVYTPAEQQECGRRREPASSYAARFAAKEALVKALGAPRGIRFREMEVAREGGAPFFRLSGTARAEVEKRKASVLLSLTHEQGMAGATVLLQEETA